MQEETAKKTLVLSAQYTNPTAFIMAVMFDENQNLKAEVEVEGSNDLSTDQPIEVRKEKFLHIITVLTRLWKLGQVYADPSKSNEEINTYQVNSEYLLDLAFPEQNQNSLF